MGENLVGYIVFFRRHVVSLENPYFSFLPEDFYPLVKNTKPHGPVLTTSLVLVGLTISRLIPAPRNPLKPSG